MGHEVNQSNFNELTTTFDLFSRSKDVSLKDFFAIPAEIRA